MSLNITNHTTLYNYSHGKTLKPVLFRKLTLNIISCLNGIYIKCSTRIQSFTDAITKPNTFQCSLVEGHPRKMRYCREFNVRQNADVCSPVASGCPPESCSHFSPTNQTNWMIKWSQQSSILMWLNKIIILFKNCTNERCRLISTITDSRKN